MYGGGFFIKTLEIAKIELGPMNLGNFIFDWWLESILIGQEVKICARIKAIDGINIFGGSLKKFVN